MRSGRQWALIAAFAALLVLPAKAEALGLQKVGDFDQPIYVASDPSDPNRLFVVEREGRIKVVAGGTTKTFADITSVVRCCESERGMFSLALAPDFPRAACSTSSIPVRTVLGTCTSPSFGRAATARRPAPCATC